jgi:hypothetical protein
MNMRSTYYSAFVIAIAILGFVACGKSGGTSAPVVPVTTPVVAAIPPGTKIGFYAQNNKMNYLYPDAVGSVLDLRATGMTNVLKFAMGVCDRNYIDAGRAACSTWLNGLHDMMIFANGSQANTVKLVIRSMLDNSCQSPNYCSSYWYSLPNFKQFILGAFGFNTYNNAGVYDPMVLDMTIWPVNNSQGFELRGYAPGGATYQGGNNLLFQFQVANGKLEDASWDFVLYYNANIVATGRMLRCQTQNCGVDGF